MVRKAPRPVDQRIGQRIRLARVDACVTQQELGFIVGCSSQQIHKYECGGNRVSAGTLFEIAHALGHPIEWFVQDHDLLASSVRH